jgi:outer membrane immunogenic protein
MKYLFAAGLGTALIALSGVAPANAGGPVAAVSEPAVAMPAAPAYAAPASNWTGGYMGAQLGYGNIKSGGAGLDGDGMLGGVYGGYRMNFGSFVTGAEVGYDSSKIKLGSTGDKLNNMMHLKLLAGYDMGKTLIYTSAGLARADTTVGGVKVAGNGLQLGIGADYALTDKWTVGGELDGNRFNNIGGSGVDLKATTVAAKIAYRF